MDLLNYRYNKYSSTGNDGIVEKILETIGLTGGFFVEFGAVDGIKGSNCRKLFEEGWSGFFIENDDNKFKKLYKNYKDIKNVTIANEKINIKGENSFDNIFIKHVGNTRIDFCSIDIDGLDVAVFESIEKNLPTVVCIEGGQMLTPFHKKVSNKVAACKIQQPLSVMVKVFENKGYKLLCSYQDVFFIKENLFHLFDVSNNIMEHYLNGLSVSMHRIPYIQNTLREVNMNNEIIDQLLEATNYKKYRWNNRKRWMKENKSKIGNLIKERIKNAN